MAAAPEPPPPAVGEVAAETSFATPASDVVPANAPAAAPEASPPAPAQASDAPAAEAAATEVAQPSTEPAPTPEPAVSAETPTAVGPPAAEADAGAAPAVEAPPDTPAAPASDSQPTQEAPAEAPSATETEPPREDAAPPVSEPTPPPAPEPAAPPPIVAPDFPPLPTFSPLVGNEARKQVFAAFEYVPDPRPDNKEHIKILGDWREKNIVVVPIPQLKKAIGPGAPAAIEFHRLAAPQLQALWAAWDDADLLKHVLSFAGGFNARFQRGSTTALSNHAYGSAFDINVAWNPLGKPPAALGSQGSVRELVPLAHKHGFYWGGHFRSRPDGMHFEIAKLL